jgi:HlyD family secretion protein
MMYPIRFFPILFLALLLTACGSSAAADTASAPTPLAPAFAPGVVVASAEIVPAQVSELGFPVGGTVKEITVSAGERVSAGQTLALLDIPELTGAVAQAEAALKAAQIEYEFYLVPRRQAPIPAAKPWKGLIAGPLEPLERRLLAKARLAAAQAALDSAKADLAQAALVAPFDGVVTTVNLRPSEMADLGRVVVVLASLDQLQVQTTDLKERDISFVQPGQPVAVYVDALDRKLPGQVLRISPRAGTKGGDVVFLVTISLDAPPPGLLWGMSAEVQIETQ